MMIVPWVAYAACAGMCLYILFFHKGVKAMTNIIERLEKMENDFAAHVAATGAGVVSTLADDVASLKTRVKDVEAELGMKSPADASVHTEPTADQPAPDAAPSDAAPPEPQSATAAPQSAAESIAAPPPSRPPLATPSDASAAPEPAPEAPQSPAPDEAKAETTKAPD